MTHRLLRDCSATAIPAGDPVTLRAGETVTLAKTWAAM